MGLAPEAERTEAGPVLFRDASEIRRVPTGAGGFEPDGQDGGVVAVDDPPGCGHRRADKGEHPAVVAALLGLGADPNADEATSVASDGTAIAENDHLGVRCVARDELTDASDRLPAVTLAAMNATVPPAGDLYLVVGYDGSPPAIRALDAAVRLLHGRTGSIEVVYVAHLPGIDMMSPGAVAEMEANFGDIARELRTAASEQLRDREERWRFERRQGLIADELIAAAGIHDPHPGDTVVIVVGSSSHAMHRMVGSVAVSLVRRAPVPLVVVP